ncbi:MAG: M10 family metallopeptidase C-terminal domain-containing protein [Nitrospira sp.]
MSGGTGNDTLIAGRTKNTLTGGLGNDRFDYRTVDHSPADTRRDIITDFSGAGSGIGDKIDLTKIDANGDETDGDQAFIWGGPFTAGHLRYVGGVVQGNLDGDAAAEFEIQLVGSPALFVQAGHAGSDILL